MRLSGYNHPILQGRTPKPLNPITSEGQLFSFNFSPFLGQRLPRTQTCPRHSHLQNPGKPPLHSNIVQQRRAGGFLGHFLPAHRPGNYISPWNAGILLQPLPLRRQLSGCLCMWVLIQLDSHPLFHVTPEAFGRWLFGSNRLFRQAPPDSRKPPEMYHFSWC